MNIIPRSEWNAREPKSVKAISTPTPHLFLHHTADNNHGHAGIRRIQDFHMDGRGWSDIAYSFLVDKFGNVFEGRGPGRAGAHTRGYNSTSHAICAVGNYQSDSPTQALLNGITSLVRYGHEQGWWPEKITGGHRDVGSTSCPGQYLYSHINSINRNARRSHIVNPDLAIYSRRNIDFASAAGIGGSAQGKVAVTHSTELAQAWVDAGVRTIAVGGGSAQDLRGEVEAVGGDAIESLIKGAQEV